MLACDIGGNKGEGMKLPPITQKPILFVDASPDEDYPLRILQAYRQEANCVWAESADGSEPLNPVLKKMNEDNRKRAKILDRAIGKLLKES